MRNATSEHRRLILWGMMGSGKTYLANKLAASLDLPVFDLDQWIEEKTGCLIPVLFQRKGESFFRDLEHEMLHDLLSLPQSFILAVGGGTVCFERNQDLFQSSDLTIYLKCSIPLLKARLINERDGRPMLQQGQIKLHDRIIQLLADREPWYQRAKVILDGDSPLIMHELELIASEYFST